MAFNKDQPRHWRTRQFIPTGMETAEVAAKGVSERPAPVAVYSASVSVGKAKVSASVDRATNGFTLDITGDKAGRYAFHLDRALRAPESPADAAAVKLERARMEALVGASIDWSR